MVADFGSMMFGNWTVVLAVMWNGMYRPVVDL
jgi:hypothetical protein